MKHEDPDKRYVYRAERRAFEDTIFARGLTSHEYLRLAAELFGHDWWQSNGLPTPIIEPTEEGAKTSYAWINPGTPSNDPIIRVHPTDINAWCLAHEAAHVAQYFFHPLGGALQAETHGPEFRDAYLAVAKIFLGDEAALGLLFNFTAYVPHRPSAPLQSFVPAPVSSGLGIYRTWDLRQRQSIFEHPAPLGAPS